MTNSEILKSAKGFIRAKFENFKRVSRIPANLQHGLSSTYFSIWFTPKGGVYVRTDEGVFKAEI